MDYKSRGLEFGKMASKAVGGGVDNAKEEEPPSRRDSRKSRSTSTRDGARARRFII